MMDRALRIIATALARGSAALLPAGRSEWGAAMEAEANAIEKPGAALVFAAGCLWAASKERMLTMKFALKAAWWLPLAMMAALAVAASTSAIRLMSTQAPVALVLSVQAAAFAMAVLWSLYRGAEALVQAASTMLLVNLVAFFVLQSPSITAGPPSEIYRALSVEGLFIWGLMLASGLFLMRAGRVSAARA
jgi:hypothetical protein